MQASQVPSQVTLALSHASVPESCPALHMQAKPESVVSAHIGCVAYVGQQLTLAALVGQAAQEGPPQSVLDSWPLSTPSSQRGAAQAPLAHTSLVQSQGCTQLAPTAQGAHETPPQSMSVSLPF